MLLGTLPSMNGELVLSKVLGRGGGAGGGGTILFGASCYNSWVWYE